MRLSGSGPAELAELSAGEDDELESEPVSKPLLRLSSRRISSTKWGLSWPGWVAGKRPPLELTHLGLAGRGAEGTEQKNRVRNKLKRLIAKRPTLQSLQERGLFRGRLGWTSGACSLCQPY